jgi:hypothetical protein
MNKLFYARSKGSLVLPVDGRLPIQELLGPNYF